MSENDKQSVIDFFKLVKYINLVNNKKRHVDVACFKNESLNAKDAHNNRSLFTVGNNKHSAISFQYYFKWQEKIWASIDFQWFEKDRLCPSIKSAYQLPLRTAFESRILYVDAFICHPYLATTPVFGAFLYKAMKFLIKEGVGCDLIMCNSDLLSLHYKRQFGFYRYNHDLFYLTNGIGIPMIASAHYMPFSKEQFWHELCVASSIRDEKIPRDTKNTLIETTPKSINGEFSQILTKDKLASLKDDMEDGLSLWLLDNLSYDDLCQSITGYLEVLPNRVITFLSTFEYIFILSGQVAKEYNGRCVHIYQPGDIIGELISDSKKSNEFTRLRTLSSVTFVALKQGLVSAIESVFAKDDKSKYQIYAKTLQKAHNEKIKFDRLFFEE